MTAHFRQIATAVQQNFEVLPNLTDEPAKQQAVDDAVGVVGHQQQWALLWNIAQGAGVQIGTDAEQFYTVGPERRGARGVSAIPVVLLLQATLPGDGFHGADESAPCPRQTGFGHRIRGLRCHTQRVRRVRYRMMTPEKTRITGR